MSLGEHISSFLPHPLHSPPGLSILTLFISYGDVSGLARAKVPIPPVPEMSGMESKKQEKFEWLKARVWNWGGREGGVCVQSVQWSADCTHEFHYRICISALVKCIEGERHAVAVLVSKLLNTVAYYLHALYPLGRWLLNVPKWPCLYSYDHTGCMCMPSGEFVRKAVCTVWACSYFTTARRTGAEILRHRSHHGVCFWVSKLIGFN